jgi:hypothetical protein
MRVRVLFLTKEGGEWMLQQIVRFQTPFIWWREGRRCCGGETVGGEWSSSMLPFQEEEMKGQHLFQKGNGARGATLSSRTEGRRMQWRGGGW